jgi:hypothetical protein
MNYPKNEVIARNLFFTLILDYEYPEVDGLPAAVYCRVLNDGYYYGSIHAGSRTEAINKFYKHEINTEV